MNQENSAEPRGWPYERLVAAVQQHLDTEAEVEWNVRIIGRSKTSRQVDVAIRGKCGSANLFVAVEAKDYGQKVGVEKVDAFAGKLNDIRANKGIMVTTIGYTRDALLRACERGIDTCVLRPASDSDWEGHVRRATLSVIMMKVACEDAKLFLENGESREVPLDGDLTLEDSHGERTTVAAVAGNVIEKARRVDGLALEGKPFGFALTSPTFFLCEGRNRVRIDKIWGCFKYVDGDCQVIPIEAPHDWVYIQELPSKQIGEKHFLVLSDLERLADQFRRGDSPNE